MPPHGIDFGLIHTTSNIYQSEATEQYHKQHINYHPSNPQNNQTMMEDPLPQPPQSRSQSRTKSSKSKSKSRDKEREDNHSRNPDKEESSKKREHKKDKKHKSKSKPKHKSSRDHRRKDGSEDHDHNYHGIDGCDGGNVVHLGVPTTINTRPAVTVSKFLNRQQQLQKDASSRKGRSFRQELLLGEMEAAGLLPEGISKEKGDYEDSGDEDYDEFDGDRKLLEDGAGSKVSSDINGSFDEDSYGDGRKSKSKNKNTKGGGVVAKYQGKSSASSRSKKPKSAPVVDTVPADHPSSSIIQTMRTCSICHRTLPRSQFSTRDRFTLNLSLAPGVTCRTCSMTVCAVRLKMMPGHDQLLLDYCNRGMSGALSGQTPVGLLTNGGASTANSTNSHITASAGAIVPVGGVHDVHSPHPNDVVTGRELVPVGVASVGSTPNSPYTFNTRQTASTTATMHDPFSGIPHEQDRSPTIADCKYIDMLLRMPCYPNLNQLALFQSSKDASVSLAALEAVRLYGTLDEGYFVPHDIYGDAVASPVNQSGGTSGGGGDDGAGGGNSGRPKLQHRRSSNTANEGDLVKVNPKSIVCLVIGDGPSPKTAILAAQHYGWTALSIDPQLSDDWDGYQEDIKGFTGYSGSIADFMDNTGEFTETVIEYSHQSVQHLVIIGIQGNNKDDSMRLRGDAHISEIRARYEDVPTTLVSLSPIRKATLAPKRMRGQIGSKLEKDVGYEPNCSYIDKGVFSECRFVEVWNFHNAEEEEEDYSRSDEYHEEEYRNEYGEDGHEGEPYDNERQMEEYALYKQQGKEHEELYQHFEDRVAQYQEELEEARIDSYDSKHSSSKQRKDKSRSKEKERRSSSKSKKGKRNDKKKSSRSSSRKRSSRSSSNRRSDASVSSASYHDDEYGSQLKEGNHATDRPNNEILIPEHDDEEHQGYYEDDLQYSRDSYYENEANHVKSDSNRDLPDSGENGSYQNENGDTRESYYSNVSEDRNRESYVSNDYDENNRDSYYSNEPGGDDADKRESYYSDEHERDNNRESYYSNEHEIDNKRESYYSNEHESDNNRESLYSNENESDNNRESYYSNEHESDTNMGDNNDENNRDGYFSNDACGDNRDSYYSNQSDAQHRYSYYSNEQDCNSRGSYHSDDGSRSRDGDSYYSHESGDNHRGSYYSNEHSDNHRGSYCSNESDDHHIEENPSHSEAAGEDHQKDEQVWEKAMAKHVVQEAFCDQFEDYYGDDMPSNASEGPSGRNPFQDSVEEKGVSNGNDNGGGYDDYQHDEYHDDGARADDNSAASRSYASSSTPSFDKKPIASYPSPRLQSNNKVQDDYSETGSNFVYDDGSSTSSGIAALSRTADYRAPPSSRSNDILGDMGSHGEEDDIMDQHLSVWSDDEEDGDVMGDPTPRRGSGLSGKQRPWNRAKNRENSDFCDSFYSYDGYDD